LVFLEPFLSNMLSPLVRLPTFAVQGHIKPLDRLVGPALVWSLPFDLM